MSVAFARLSHRRAHKCHGRRRDGAASTDSKCLPLVAVLSGKSTPAGMPARARIAALTSPWMTETKGSGAWRAEDRPGADGRPRAEGRPLAEGHPHQAGAEALDGGSDDLDVIECVGPRI